MAMKLSNRKLMIGGGVLAVVLLAWFFWPRNGNGREVTAVARGTIVQTIQVTGKTKPAQNIEMSFDRSGRIASAPVSVGDHVEPGQVLAALDSGDLYAQLKQQQAKLEALMKGARSEDVAVAQTAADKARSALDQALTDAYTNADDAVRNRGDQFFDNPHTDYALLSPSLITLDSLRRDINDRRQNIERTLSAWKKMIDNRSGSTSPLDEYRQANSALTEVKRYLEVLSSIVNSNYPNGINTATQLSGWRADLSAARSEVNTSLSELSSTFGSWQEEQNKLILKKAPPTSEDVKIEQAEIDGIRAQIAKNTIIAPIAGIVTRQDASVGETAAAGVNVITVMSDGKFEIEADVPEVDIGKVAMGDTATVTVDALPGQLWSGRVTYIEPAETIVNGVVNYKIKVALTEADPRLKSGLTANLMIETARLANVLYLPSYAIIENDLGAFVDREKADKKTERVPVKIGIRGGDGRTEIVSGLKEGERVVTGGPK
jgi:HlyD family secretion protein